jgi:hypothetical protein
VPIEPSLATRERSAVVPVGTEPAWANTVPIGVGPSLLVPLLPPTINCNMAIKHRIRPGYRLMSCPPCVPRLGKWYSWAAAVLISSVITVAGCTEQPGAGTLVFQRTSSYATASAEAASSTHLFPFHVWHNSDVRIRRIARTCACLYVDPPLEGTVLPAGSEQALVVRVRRVEGETLLGGVVIIETDPPSPTPIRIQALTMFGARPAVHPAKQTVYFVLGNDLRFQLTAVLSRPQGSPRLELQARDSDFGPFSLCEQQYSSRVSKTHPQERDPPQIDLLKLAFELKSPNWLGKRQYRLTLKWKGGFPPCHAEVTVFGRPPLWPELDRLFCGELKPGQKWQFKLRLRSAPGAEPHLVKVRTDSSFIHCSYSRDTQTLDVVVFAPSRLGRFEGNIIPSVAKSQRRFMYCWTEYPDTGAGALLVAARR